MQYGVGICCEVRNCVEVAPSQIIICRGNALHNQHMHALGGLFRERLGSIINYVDSNFMQQQFWCNNYRIRSHFPIHMLILSYQYLCHQWLYERTR